MSGAPQLGADLGQEGGGESEVLAHCGRRIGVAPVLEQFAQMQTLVAMHRMVPTFLHEAVR